MPGDPNECCMRARRCIELAAGTADPDVKKKFTDLAVRWNQIANEIDGLNAPPVDKTI
jgi:hypothetical protein